MTAIVRIVSLVIAATALVIAVAFATQTNTVDQWAVGDHKISCGSVVAPSTAQATAADNYWATSPFASDPAMRAANTYQSQCEAALSSTTSQAVWSTTIALLAGLAAVLSPTALRTVNTRNRTSA